MNPTTQTPCSAFEGVRQIASGPLEIVALVVKARQAQEPERPLLVFELATGRVIDLDLRGSDEAVIARLTPPEDTLQPSGEPRGRGRPKLGVVPREVTLLPRHWDWLNAQPGGASVSLRKLVEEARRAGSAEERRRSAQERTFRFMAAMAGDEPGFEEALRALYAANRGAFETITAAWPADVRQHAWQSARPAFGVEHD